MSEFDEIATAAAASMEMAAGLELEDVEAWLAAAFDIGDAECRRRWDASLDEIRAFRTFRSRLAGDEPAKPSADEPPIGGHGRSEQA